MWYTNRLIEVLSKEERKKVKNWAEAQNTMVQSQSLADALNFIMKIVEYNETVPVILTNDKDSIISTLNLNPQKVTDSKYLRKQLNIMKEQHAPIVIEEGDIKQYLYHKDSIILTQLFYYPFVQLGIIFLFIIVSYLVFSTSRRAEQNQVWVGMSKETAHQLGTPISSLIAWVELLKLKEKDQTLVTEVEKDVKRLETITERFSKIGSTPVMKPTNINEVLINSVNYLKTRTSNKVKFELNLDDEENIVPINTALFEWVIENLCKNAIDAMNGNGIIEIKTTDYLQVIYIDISDTGKGLPKSKYKTIFHPGYTTKKRGWGLGLSLTKRIIEQYHKGKIFVKQSEQGIGTIFRIVLHK